MSSWLCPGIECRHPLADHIVGVTDDTLVCQVEGCACAQAGQDAVERLRARTDARPADRAHVDQMKDHLRLLGHLSWLDEQHGLLEGLYDWDHDAQGYRAGRTCRACGTRSGKHAQLDARHTADCHLRAVEDALGISQYGVSGTRLDEFVADVEATSTDEERAELEAFRQWHRQRRGRDDC